MDINFELYKVFYYVAKNLSFSKASRDLFISQSAISQSIRTLEAKLDTKLFIRSTKSVQLTQEGALLFEHIEPAINLIHSGHLSLLESPSLSKGTLHIGASDTICKYYLLNYINQFHQLFPKIKIQVTNRTSTDCVKLLKQNKVDFIVINIPNTALDSDFNLQPVLSFEDVFICNASFSKLAGKKLTLEEIASSPILMLEKASATSRYLYEVFEKQNIRLTPDVELGSIDLLICLSRIGLGIAFVPKYCLGDTENDLIQLKLINPLASRQLAIVTQKQKPLNLASQKFIELLL